jgi:hypothetical protein
MSIATSEINYKIAHDLYLKIEKQFYEIENENSENNQFSIKETLDDIYQLSKSLEKINIDELREKYEKINFAKLEKNVNHFKESVFYIERAIKSIQLYDKLNPVLSSYMKHVDWSLIDKDIKEATSKFSRFLTNESNFEQYKNSINGIIRGTMKEKSFKDFYNAVQPRMPKSKVNNHRADENFTSLKNYKELHEI